MSLLPEPFISYDVVWSLNANRIFAMVFGNFGFGDQIERPNNVEHAERRHGSLFLQRAQPSEPTVTVTVSADGCRCCCCETLSQTEFRVQVLVAPDAHAAVVKRGRVVCEPCQTHRA